MKKFIIALIGIGLIWPLQAMAQRPTPKQVDICVYGGTSLGVIAAYTAKKHGKSVLLIEPTNHIGGMTTGGLGQTDIGNKYVIQGLALDFYRRVGAYYNALEMWVFEPHVASKVFDDYIKEGDIEVWRNRRIVAASKKGSKIVNITLEDSTAPSKKTNLTVEAKVFIDCTYEGDLMAKAGISYTIGREDNKVYGETYSGVQMLERHQFKPNVKVDPYIIPGKKSSGLVYGVSKGKLLPSGTGDKKVQAYNFRICLTCDKDNMIPITKPENYDPSKYELLVRWKAQDPWKMLEDAFIWSKMPNNKTDINNRGAFSTDMIGANWDYPEASYKERARIAKEHEDYTKGLLYFVGHDERIPAHIRTEMLRWGYPKDEYVDNNHWTPQIYVREARRMISDVVMTQHHCQGREVVNDGIAYAAYTMDSHNCDRLVVDGYVRNEGNVEIKKDVKPYPISYRSIVPNRKEASNLFVTFCLSASHIAFGSIRMEPVAMALSQVAATAASMAIDNYNGVVQDVDVATLNAELTARPFADNSKVDILIDEAKEGSVKFEGKWIFDSNSRKSYAYGRHYNNTLGKDNSSVYFYPQLKATDEYKVYYYYSKQEKPSSVINLNIFDGATIHEIALKTDSIKIIGQTYGEWVYVGTFKFAEGNTPYVAVTNKDADGTIVADAIQLIPTKR